MAGHQRGTIRFSREMKRSDIENSIWDRGRCCDGKLFQEELDANGMDGEDETNRMEKYEMMCRFTTT